MSARTAALRFRIWQYAAPREWDVTCTEIADALGESYQRISYAMRHGGWNERIRASVRANAFEFGGNHAIDNNARHIAAQVVAGRISSEAAI